MLENYIVTLDSRSKSAYFNQYSEAPLNVTSFGFSLAFKQGISIGAVWDNSPAQTFGLKTGLEITSINGIATEYTSDGIARALAAMGEDTIEIGWQGGSVTLTRANVF